MPRVDYLTSLESFAPGESPRSVVFSVEEMGAGWRQLYGAFEHARLLRSRVLLAVYCPKCGFTHEAPNVVELGKGDAPVPGAVNLRERTEGRGTEVTIDCPAGHRLSDDFSIDS